MSLKFPSNTFINSNINNAFKEYNNLLFNLENQYTNKAFTTSKTNSQITIDTLDFIKFLFSLLIHHSEFIAQLLSAYHNLSDTIPCKEQIISKLILANQETTKDKINAILNNNSLKSLHTLNKYTKPNLILTFADSFTILNRKEEEKVFESFGNVLNSNSLNIKESNNSNNSSFTFNNSKIPDCNSNSNEYIDTYIKLSNDNVISKIKSKINLKNKNSYLTRNNNFPPYLSYIHSSITSREEKSNKGINIISPKKDKDARKYKESIRLITNIENKNNYATLETFDEENVKGNLIIDNSNFNGKKDLLMYINTKEHKKPKRKNHKISFSCEFKKKKIHLLESSLNSNTTSMSISSKRYSRQSTVTNWFNSKASMEHSLDANAKKRTKKFYQNIKNVKSKYSNFMKKSNKSKLLWESIKAIKLKNFSKGPQLNQYINSKNENRKMLQK